MNRRQFASFGCAALLSVATPRLGWASPRRLRLGHNNNKQSIAQAGAEAFAKAVASLSEGRLAVDIFPNSTVGNEKQMMKAVSNGTLDASVNTIGSTEDNVSAMSLADLPFLFRDVAAARKGFDGALGRTCADILQSKGIIVTGWGEIGLCHTTANKAIRHPADLKGLKLRVPVSQPMLRTFLAMGAAAEALPLAQMNEALRTGRIESVQTQMSNVVAGRLDTLQSHLSLTGHSYTPFVFAFSRDVFEDMSPADREVIVRSGAAGALATRTFADAMETRGPVRLQAAGMTIVRDVDHVAFLEAAQGAYETLSLVFGADTMKRIRTLAAA